VDGYYFDFIPKAKNNVISDESNLKQSIVEIKNYLIKNKTTQRNDATGWFIEITEKSINKWFSQNIGFIKLKAFTVINEIIKVGILVKSEKANKKTATRDKIHHFWSIVSVDGKNYPFGFLVIEKNGKYIYNTTLVPVEKTIKPTGLAGFKFIKDFSSIPKLKQYAINKLSKVKVKNKNEIPKSHKIIGTKVFKKTEKGLEKTNLSGILSTEQMAGFKYKELALNPYYAKILGKPATNFDMCIHGEPGSGKTVFLLKLANYLAENFGKVIYVTTEEFGSATLTKKIKDFGINSKNLFFTDKLDKVNLSDYNFAFIDSVNHSGLKLEDYKRLREKSPNTAVILILQTTKTGTYKGGKDWPHEVEICARLFKNEKGQRMIEITKDRYTDLRTVKI
jgi:chromosomal replication initiation ATPase DnaA